MPSPPVYIPCGEPRGPQCRPRLCPLRHPGTRPPPLPGPIRRLHGHCRPVGAQRLPVSSLCPSGPHWPFSAACDRSRRGLHHPTSREGVRGLPDPLCRRRRRRNALTPLRASLRDTLISYHLWRSWWRISRSAPTRRDGSKLITGVCSISPSHLAIGPGSPPDWSVFMWMIELTCGSLFGRLLPSCISVLSFIVSILAVIRSV